MIQKFMYHEHLIVRDLDDLESYLRRKGIIDGAKG